MSKGSPVRVDRRKARTRAALIAAARTLIVEGRSETASIQEIADRADVGFGSFYNHFSSKVELFREATTAVLDEWAAIIEHAVEGTVDPAERFATSFRISARLAWSHPELAGVLNGFGLDLLDLDEGFGPRAVRDVTAGIDQSRFTVTHLPVAMSTIGGSLLGFLRLKVGRPDLVEPEAVEDLTAQLLRMLGVDEAEARRLCSLPVPTL
ncbi:TetR/AcrR family transcriptional regulator [Aeromicrobium sp. Root495]|uniref:TetR/AcrR family transcriptional regulator n=1 Tax=Aeromicrobium sp. Root495 TaxID=1736550 RepID=UPI001910E842|nr:TetR/AcrR family transcriptional regulator [Aeromicrobium sp. Root495]